MRQKQHLEETRSPSEHGVYHEITRPIVNFFVKLSQARSLYYSGSLLDDLIRLLRGERLYARRFTPI